MINVSLLFLLYHRKSFCVSILRVGFSNSMSRFEIGTLGAIYPFIRQPSPTLLKSV
jgi:hypothetical protein